MSLGGGQTQTPVAGSNKYAEIMELMRRRNAMNNSTYTGGFNAYPGGFNAYPVAAPSSGSSSAYDELLRLQALANANQRGGGNDGLSSNPGWDAMTDAQKAGYYAENPTMGKITQFGQTLFGFTPLANLQTQEFRDRQALIAQGINPDGPTPLSGLPASKDPLHTESEGPLNTDTSPPTTAPAAPTTSTGKPGETEVGSTGYGVFDNSAPGAGYGQTASGGIDGSFYSQGGQVTMNRLRGPNPMGPDDGYGGLDDGEFVINAKSVGKYGIELMNAINAGKISKGKLRGLLEA